MVQEGLTHHKRKLGKSAQSVPHLSKLIQRLHRNVTVNKRFSSVQLIKELKQGKLGYVGTHKK
jgi:hypothetical protein